MALRSYNAFYGNDGCRLHVAYDTDTKLVHSIYATNETPETPEGWGDTMKVQITARPNHVLTFYVESGSPLAYTFAANEAFYLRATEAGIQLGYEPLAITFVPYGDPFTATEGA